ncbi:MAG: DUF547 domain-containing protein [Alphaproteobacteria bacterium]
MRSAARLVAGLVLVLMLGMAQAIPDAGAAPKAELWPRWQAHDPASSLEIDHAKWDQFLNRYLKVGDDGINRVAYGRVTAPGRAGLGRYISALAAVPVHRLARPQQFALWINLYNALTVKTILDHYPVKSIRDIGISPGWFAIGPWGAKLVTIGGVALSLDDIEHRILRPIWRDPRIHYAVNCAAVGCPNLMARAFTAGNARDMLDRAARAYVNHPRGVRLDGTRLRVSSLYHWYLDDFGGNDAGLIAHIRRYGGPALAKGLGRVTAVTDQGYDWSLNDATAKPHPSRPAPPLRGDGRRRR